MWKHLPYLFLLSRTPQKTESRYKNGGACSATAQETHLMPNGQIIPRFSEAMRSIGELLCRAGADLTTLRAGEHARHIAFGPSGVETNHASTITWPDPRSYPRSPGM